MRWGGQPGQIGASQDDTPGGRPQGSGDQVKNCRFSAAVRAHQRPQFPQAQGQIDSINRGNPAEILVHVVQCQKCHRHFGFVVNGWVARRERPGL